MAASAKVEAIDLTLSPPPVTIDLSEDNIDVDLSQDEVIFITPRAPVFQRPNHPLRFATYPGVPSSTTLGFANRNWNKRPAETIVLDDDGPPLKRTRNTSLPVFSKATPNVTVQQPPTVRQPSIKREIIELDSDGEQTPDRQNIKKFKQDESVSSDEGSDYDCIHAGYDLSNSHIWKPTPANEDKVEQGLLDSIRQLSVSSPPPRPYVDISDRSATKGIVTHPSFIWEQLLLVPLLAQSYRRNTVHQALLPPSSHGRKQYRRTTTPEFRCQATFKDAPGSINKIAQSGSWIGICSAAVGGHADGPDEREYPYNREGSVMIWNETLQTLPGHRQDKGQYTKHYTVNDIKPDPTSPGMSFVSSGNDKRVRVWTREADENSFSPSQEWRFRNVPHDLAFKPGEAILAVAERKIYIYSNILEDSSDTILPLTGKHTDHCVGAMVWGLERTSDLLFASSEPPLDHELKGYHKAFDINKQKMAYQFDAHEAGDAICISADGARLALLTRGRDRTHILRLYDIARGLYSDGQMTQLEPFPDDIDGEVNSATFSPDGIHLALGRNDNHTHVYDSRMLNKLLFDYEHHGPCRTSPGSESYGVVQTQWVESGSRRLPAGLVTGGNDGCVRFWDPLRAARDPINGRILVESNSDVGCFSLGDHYLGERDIVVGDCAGEISIFEMSYWGA